MPKLPLEGVRILDLSMFMAGPMATCIAADLGAEVIKVESVQRIDGWRGTAWAPGVDRPYERAPSFNWINRNKYDITLNLNDWRGIAIIKKLVPLCDALVENYTPRVMENFGLTYDVLSALNPRLVMLSMPGYGLTGPWRDYTSFAWPTEQMAGLTYLTGYPDGPPMFTASTGGDPLSGIMGAVALLMALHYQRRTGKGQHIDLSQTEACTNFVGDAIMEYTMNGRSPTRKGNKHAWMAPHGIYPCLGEDRWLAIAVASDEQWQCLCEIMGQPQLASDQRFADLPSRYRHQDELNSLLAAWTSQHEARELMIQLQAAGIMAAPVMNGKDLLEDPHLQARGFFLEQDREVVGRKHYPGLPIKFAGFEALNRSPAPLLGEHNRHVLTTLLGMSEDELEELERADVIGTVPIIMRQQPDK